MYAADGFGSGSGRDRHRRAQHQPPLKTGAVAGRKFGGREHAGDGGAGEQFGLPAHGDVGPAWPCRAAWAAAMESVDPARGFEREPAGHAEFAAEMSGDHGVTGRVDVAREGGAGGDDGELGVAGWAFGFASKVEIEK